MKKHGVIKKCIALALGTTLIMGVAGCVSSGADSAGTETETTLLIAAAASLEATFEDTLIPMFEEANPGIQVEGTYASSGDLQQQIESGLEADLFMQSSIF